MIEFACVFAFVLVVGFVCVAGMLEYERRRPSAKRLAMLLAQARCQADRAQQERDALQQVIRATAAHLLEHADDPDFVRGGAVRLGRVEP